MFAHRVKILRLLLKCLVLAIALVAVLIVLAFSPIVQTWMAQRALARSPALMGSLESLVARFGRVEITDFQATRDGVNLKVPGLVAEFPIVTALWHRRLAVRRLVARGWTLDLSGRPGSGTAPGPAGSAATGAGAPGARAQVTAETAARGVARIGHSALSRWALPCDLSLDGVDLEGDVLVGASAGLAPARVHVTVKGGGMAAGHD